MHESNSFNPQPTTLANFSFRTDSWAAGDTEVAGMMTEGEHRGLELMPILYAGATPRGPVEAEAFETLCGRLLEGIRTAGILEGALLALHGAMYTDAYPQADEEIARRVRSVIGPKCHCL